MPRSKQPTSLTEVVTARLRREIVDGEFEFGQALSESRIASRYGVSRTPVREAFARLDLEGLVRTEPQHGTFVLSMDRDQFAQISEVRAILEIAALRRAVVNNKNELVKHWKCHVTAMNTAKEEGDGKRYSRIDGEFHQALFDVAANPFLEAAGQSFAAKMAAVRNRLGSQPAHMVRSFAEHVALLDLIERNETDHAAEVLERHIRYKGESFWAVPKTVKKSRWQKISELAE